MKTRGLFAFVIVSLSAAQFGCGSSDSPSGSGGGSTGGASGSSAGSAGNSGGSTASDFPASIAPEADVRMLSDADKRKLCDWVNATMGGYGLATQCNAAENVSNDTDQAECVATFFMFRCKVTAAQVEACTLDEAPKHGCDRTFPSCMPLDCQ